MRIVQPSGREVYAFSADVTEILATCDVPHIGRDPELQLEGYQRSEISPHVREIRSYLDMDDAVLPNAIVVAFDGRASFVPRGEHSGILSVPSANGDGGASGFVIDGQQRLAALAASRHDRFPVFVTALLGCDVSEQRRQFVLVNRTRPLTPGLVYELLPTIEGTLPPSLARQRLAARITEELNYGSQYSLFGAIRTPTWKRGYTKDNSIRRMLMNSLTDGALFVVAAEDPEAIPAMAEVVSTFWAGAKRVFGDAASLPPKHSRLTHGVGVVSMGFVMDHIFEDIGRDRWEVAAVAEALEPLRERCAWTAGMWHFANESRPWDALQNVDRDVRLLADYLLRCLTQGTRED